MHFAQFAVFALAAGVLLGADATPDALTKPGADGFRHNGITAHRGSQAQAPENLLQAFENAIRDGADWIELDIFTTRDGKIVVIHDATTGRVGDRDVRVNDVTYEELRQVDIATSYRKAAGLTIAQCPAVPPPLLSEAIALVKRHPEVHLSIQPKDGSTDAAVRMVKEMDAVRQVGFNDGSLDKMARVKELEPRLTVHWDRPAKIDVRADIETARKHKFEAIVVKTPGVTQEMVRQFKDAGFEFGVWVANKPGEIARFLEWGVDRIYTDHPDVALEVKRERLGSRKPK